MVDTLNAMSNKQRTFMQNIYEFISSPILLGVVNFVLQHIITSTSKIPFCFDEYVFMSLTLGKCGCNIEIVIKLDALNTPCEIAIRLIPHGITND